LIDFITDALKQLLIIRPTAEPDGVPISDKKIKRERENNVQGEGSRKKSKKSKDIETIDLTHDS
jgi:hypothetical protein